MHEDISDLLKGWRYDPHALSVRLIQGKDGRPKVQMRIDLGLLQMEMDGRPDGERPYGYESLLEYHLARLEEHQRLYGSDEGFFLTSEECQELIREAYQYYHRYLSLFHLEDFARAARDTARNLRVFDLLKRYAQTEEDRYALEVYRPYVIMMNTKSRAALRLREGDFQGALVVVEEGIGAIRDFFHDLGHPELMAQSRELRILEDLAEQLRPLSPVERLERALQEALKQEDYERAAQLRDELRRLRHQ